MSSLMKQVFQDPRGGTIEVAALPEPALRPGTLLVRNACSMISPGTERNHVKLGRDSLLTTARARPDLVRRVVDTVRREGVLAAYRKVQARRSELRPLGYASAGTVVAVGAGAGDHFRVGDRVACAGAGHASHAEVVCVPANLAARVPEGVPFEAAAFATLGAVALHGVRQARPALGERWAVVGLGVLGLLTVQLLRAAGARVIAFDLSSDRAARARALGAEAAADGDADAQVAVALSWSDGVGVDGVIVTAASSDDAPMVAAAGMCRERGRVAAVGLVPFGLPRDIAYQKELELTIARSYGPGRYDPDFEEKGIDYPIEYVRWTETRNLEAFLHLVAERKVTPQALVTHRFPIDEAPRAYDLLVEGQDGAALGLLLIYPSSPTPAASPAAPTPATVPLAASVPAVVAGIKTVAEVAAAPLDRTVREPPRAAAPTVAPGQPIEIGVIGAGSFARSTLLPILKKRRDVRLRSVVTTQGVTALQAQRRFGFDRIGTDPDLIFTDPDVHLVFIATRHDSHADLAARALQAGKHVFVEKPLAINEAQLASVEAAAANAPGMLMVGYNRRYSPHARALCKAFAGRGPLMMTYRVNASPLPSGHWLNDPQVGGGRIIGEACHFIDLMSYLTGDASIESVQTEWLDGGDRRAVDVSAILRFGDGSVGHLLYTARGAPGAGKERLEVHGNGASGVIDDFRSCTVHSARRAVRVRFRDKGHREEVEATIRAVRHSINSPTRPGGLIGVARASFRIAGVLTEGT